MAIKRDLASASAIAAVAASSAPRVSTPTVMDPDVAPSVPVLDDEDRLILDGLSYDILDVVFGSVAQETGDGELLAVLHLTLEILEAEQIFGSVGTLMADLSVPQPTVPEPTVVLAVEFTKESEEESQATKEYGHGDYAVAGDYFDCFEGAGIAINEGYVQLKRSSRRGKSHTEM